MTLDYNDARTAKQAKMYGVSSQEYLKRTKMFEGICFDLEAIGGVENYGDCWRSIIVEGKSSYP